VTKVSIQFCSKFDRNAVDIRILEKVAATVDRVECSRSLGDFCRRFLPASITTVSR